MSFTVQDYHDLVDLLENHPQWRSDLRRLLLSDDLLALPAIVDKLAVTVGELAEAKSAPKHGSLSWLKPSSILSNNWLR